MLFTRDQNRLTGVLGGAIAIFHLAPMTEWVAYTHRRVRPSGYSETKRRAARPCQDCGQKWPPHLTTEKHAKRPPSATSNILELVLTVWKVGILHALPLQSRIRIRGPEHPEQEC